ELLWFQLPGEAAPWGTLDRACQDEEEQRDEPTSSLAPRLLLPTQQDARAGGGKEGDPTKRREVLGLGLASAVDAGVAGRRLEGEQRGGDGVHSQSRRLGYRRWHAGASGSGCRPSLTRLRHASGR